jgi:hypothetical protein
MATSSLWAAISPDSQFRAVTNGFTDGGADPTRQTVASDAPVWSPQRQTFPFGVCLLVTGALIYYVFETGGVRYRAGGQVGPVAGDVSAGVHKS